MSIQDDTTQILRRKQAPITEKTSVSLPLGRIVAVVSTVLTAASLGLYAATATNADGIRALEKTCTTVQERQASSDREIRSHLESIREEQARQAAATETIRRILMERK